MRHSFNPHTDIVRNGFGVYEWAPHVAGLKYDVRGVFARRDDDAEPRADVVIFSGAGCSG